MQVLEKYRSSSNIEIFFFGKSFHPKNRHPSGPCLPGIPGHEFLPLDAQAFFQGLFGHVFFFGGEIVGRFGGKWGNGKLFFCLFFGSVFFLNPSKWRKINAQFPRRRNTYIYIYIMFTYVKFTANLWIANLVNELRQWFSLCKVAFYNCSKKSNSHQKNTPSETNRTSPRKKKNCIKILRFKKWKKSTEKWMPNMFKPWIFQLRHGFSTSTSPQKKCPMISAPPPVAQWIAPSRHEKSPRP